jgi:hypothetical protein
MAAPGPVDSSQLIMSVGATLSPNGQIAQINVVRANGETVQLPFPVAAAGAIMLTIEKALGTVFEKQRSLLKGQDPRVIFPIASKQVRRIQGAFAQDGRPVLSLVLTTGLRMDFALDQTTVPELMTWLQELEIPVKHLNHGHSEQLRVADAGPQPPRSGITLDGE